MKQAKYAIFGTHNVPILMVIIGIFFTVFNTRSCAHCYIGIYNVNSSTDATSIINFIV